MPAYGVLSVHYGMNQRRAAELHIVPWHTAVRGGAATLKVARLAVMQDTGDSYTRRSAACTMNVLPLLLANYTDTTSVNTGSGIVTRRQLEHLRDVLRTNERVSLQDARAQFPLRRECHGTQSRRG